MSEIGEALARELGRERVTDDAAALAAHRTDYWILAHLRARQGRLAGGPACVVKPRSTAEVATAIQARGYTTGNYPQSIDRSTVGGWVATRAAGQFSTRYGNIEDLCLGLEVVLPSGEVARCAHVPRAAVGPQLRELFLGSEGTLGVVTEVVLRLHPLPAARQLASFAFPSMAAGLDTVRRLLRVGWRPAVLRVYDALESGRHFPTAAPVDHAMLIVVSEGPTALVAAEMAACAEEAAAGGGQATGAAPAAHWLETRNTVPSWDFFLAREMLADTIEVAATWDRIGTLYDTVVAALASAPGVIMASGHSSHAYAQGTNIYFTFVLKPADFANAEADYLEGRSRHRVTRSHWTDVPKLRATASATRLIATVTRAIRIAGTAMTHGSRVIPLRFSLIMSAQSATGG